MMSDASGPTLLSCVRNRMRRAEAERDILPAPGEDEETLLQQMPAYQIGRLNCYGGGNVDWWLDYIRAELDRADQFYREYLRIANDRREWRAQWTSAGISDAAAVVRLTAERDAALKQLAEADAVIVVEYAGDIAHMEPDELSLHYRYRDEALYRHSTRVSRGIGDEDGK